MHLTRLAVTDFRSYAAADVRLSPGVSVFVGANGQGKTNLLEAADYLATFASHRVANDAPLVRAGAQRGYVRAEVARDERMLRFEVEIAPGRANRVRVNGAPLSRPREALGLFRTVLFAPTDLALVQGDPAGRRGFLDDLLVARAPRLAAVRADYDRVLRQRNSLLRSAAAAGRRGGDLSTLDVWDRHLATTGGTLLAARVELLGALRPLVDKAYDAVSPRGGEVSAEYRSSAADGLPDGPEALTRLLLDALADRRREEIDRGVTLVGPHRDDVVLGLNGLPARGYASHGESWSLALGLRLAAFDLLRADGVEPVLLLDDVFAELDVERRERLAGRAVTAEQLLVTCAVAADVPAALSGARFSVRAGTVTRDD